MKLLVYNNRPYSIIVAKRGDKFEASISVHGATSVGETEQEAIDNLISKVGIMEYELKKGKDKLILG